MDWKRAASTAFFVLLCFCVGIEQRLWSAHLKSRRQSEAREDAALQARLSDQESQLNDELNKLSPDSKLFFQELLFDAREQMLVSPVIEGMRDMSFGSPASADPDEAAQAAQRRYDGFKRLENSLETAWWVVGASAMAWCLAVWLLGKDAVGGRLADACLSASHVWFLAVSCLCALWAGLSLKNPWLDLPASFYFAPILVCAASFLADQSEESMLRAGAALQAPAVCLALSLLAAALA